MSFFNKNFLFGQHNSLPEFIQKLLLNLENADTHNNALDLLFDYAKNGEIEQINGVLFKKDEFTIQNMFKQDGLVFEENLKKINNLRLNIAPKHIKTIVKDNDMFIISKINGTKTGSLIPYIRGRKRVSEENKLETFNDLQKLTNNGLTDDKIISSIDYWFITPDNNKIMLPVFSALRNIEPGEKETVNEKYYNIIFGRNNDKRIV